ncbi:MAG: hypothetical protein ACJ8AT_15690 [Hyalangium sp.]
MKNLPGHCQKATITVGEPPCTPTECDDNSGRSSVYFVHSFLGGSEWEEIKANYMRMRDFKAIHSKERQWMKAGLGDMISVHVANHQALSKNFADCDKIVLFIDRMAIEGLHPESCDNLTGSVRYRLDRTESSEDVWRVLLGRPSSSQRQVSISIGLSNRDPIQTSVYDFQLVAVPKLGFFIYLSSMVVLLVVLLRLCKRTGLIRAGVGDIEKRPYSLSLFQMVFWLYLVVGAYVFIWMVNGELSNLNESVLAMMSIGAATALGSQVIDINKATARGISPAGPSPDTRQPLELMRFLEEVLKDENGNICLHRFQLFVWTLVLGVIFCRSVYSTLEMPEFSVTLLGLMGISSGTYLGFKLPEGSKVGSQSATLPPPPATAPATKPAELGMPKT